MNLYIKALALFLFLFPLNSHAQKISLDRSLVDRQVKNISVLANYSYFDLWIPSKYGLSLSITPDSKASYDIEYLKAELSLGWFIEDLGSFSDQRLSILRRSFNGRNSFNFIMGAFYSKTQVNIGSRLLSGITPQTNYDVLEIENLGFTFGLGNRWVMKNGLTIGADWVAVNIPIHNLKTKNIFGELTSNTDDRENAEDLVNIFKSIPSITILKVQLGYSF